MPAFATSRFDFPTMKDINGNKAEKKAASEGAPEAEKPCETAPIVEEKIDFSNVQIEPLFEDLVD